MKTTDYKSIAKKLKFEGRAYINGKYVDAIGGYKQSGSLRRDQGTEALNQYLQTKTIWISLS